MIISKNGINRFFFTFLFRFYTGLDSSRETNYQQAKEIIKNIPTCVVEKKPVLNQKLKDLQAAYDFYKEYGRVCGFDIRKAQEKSDISTCFCLQENQ